VRGAGASVIDKCGQGLVGGIIRLAAGTFKVLAYSWTERTHVLRLLGGLVLRSSMRWWRQVEVGGGGVGIQAATVGRGGASS